MSSTRKRRKVTVQTFINKKAKGEKITVLTAYDAFIAGLLDKAEIDSILVGDSASNVLHGFDTTIPITMDIMVAHTAAVARGASRALIIARFSRRSRPPFSTPGGFSKRATPRRSSSRAGSKWCRPSGGLSSAAYRSWGILD